MSNRQARMPSGSPSTAPPYPAPKWTAATPSRGANTSTRGRDAQTGELVEHADGQHVGAAQDDVVAHAPVFTATVRARRRCDLPCEGQEICHNATQIFSVHKG